MVFSLSELMKPKFSGSGNWLLYTDPESTAPKLVGGTYDVSLAGPWRTTDDRRRSMRGVGGCGVFGTGVTIEVVSSEEASAQAE
jgi:hypothetical protein